MIDLSQITGFDWDEGNARKNDDKHGVSMAEAEQVLTRILPYEECVAELGQVRCGLPPATLVP